MLEQLDKIRWSELRDCYGTSESIPDLIRELISRDSKLQAQALDELANRICHQATRYQATAPAVPFLLYLARSSKTLNRDRILSLLQAIAIGLDFDQLYFQTKVDDEIAELKRQAAIMTERQRRELNWGPASDLDCYCSVREGVPCFIKLLGDKDRSVRIHAGYNLAWFPADHRKSLPRLRERVKSVRHTAELAMTILSVGLLEFQASVSRTSKSLVRPFLTDRRELMRFTAALYLYWHDRDEVVLSHLRELSQREDYDSYVGSNSIPFAGYSWNQYAARLIDLHEASNAGNKAVSRSRQSSRL